MSTGLHLQLSSGHRPGCVNDEVSVSQALAQLLHKAGRIDVQVNNAGYGLYGAIEQTTVAQAKVQFDTNFWGVMRTAIAVLAQMRQQGSGRILTIGSMAGHVGLHYQAYYSASKHALEAFNEALRIELYGSGIDAGIICSGDFRTGFTAARTFAASAHQHANPGRYAQVLRMFERDENQWEDPALVAALAAALVQARKLNVRYLSGKWSQRASMLIKRCIPAAYFEKLFMRTYGIR